MAVLRGCEVAVLQNVHHDAQLLYRHLSTAALTSPHPPPPPAASTTGAGEPSPSSLQSHSAAVGAAQASAAPSALIHLFTFPFPMSLSPSPASPPLSALSLSFNRSNPDLLAVGYGSYTYRTALDGGLLLFWSYINASFPHRIIRTPSSVLCVDFSTESPHLLAVGLANGHVQVYDLRESGGMSASTVSAAGVATPASTPPLLQSSVLTGKHRGCVWQVRWVVREGRGEVLMSISSDGQILQWSMKKGLIPKPIMSLRRGQESKEGLSREGSGLCFDFPLPPPSHLSLSSSSTTSSSTNSHYYAGTEDGIIHRCSVSYNEQQLDNYTHHTGGVYAIRCSPFLNAIFLSASHDQTTAVWHTAHTQPIAVITSSHATATSTTSSSSSASSVGCSDVMDLAWNPSLGCAFAQCTRDGRLEVWDLEEGGVLDPIMTLDIGAGAQCVTWAGQSVVLVGDDRGRVQVYRVEGRMFTMPIQPHALAFEEQAQKLEEACFKHRHTTQQHQQGA